MNYTPKQLKILHLIHDYQKEHHVSPTYAELAKSLSVSTITVFEHLEALERKGAIRRRRHEARSVEIIDTSFLQARAQALVQQKGMPLRGTIAAGLPLEVVEAEAEILPLEEIIGFNQNNYLLRVKGDSMIEDHIMDGDLVIVEHRVTANDGEIVVALDNDGQATLKRFYRENGKIRLQPSNSAMAPIIVDDCRVQGIYKGLVRKA